MARGINKVILVGNLGNDPDINYTAGGMCIATLSVATTSVRKDKDGNTQEKTEWHRAKLFGKVAEIAAEYLKKGRQVYLEGRLSYGSYEKDGVKHYTTDIICDDMQMLGGGDGQRSEGGTQRPAQSQQQRPQQSGGYGTGGTRQPPAQQSRPANFDDVPFDDDIPF